MNKLPNKDQHLVFHLSMSASIQIIQQKCNFYIKVIIGPVITFVLVLWIDLTFFFSMLDICSFSCNVFVLSFSFVSHCSKVQFGLWVVLHIQIFWFLQHAVNCVDLCEPLLCLLHCGSLWSILVVVASRRGFHSWNSVDGIYCVACHGVNLLSWAAGLAVLKDVCILISRVSITWRRHSRGSRLRWWQSTNGLALYWADSICWSL